MALAIADMLQGGMLSLESQIIDATTEDGKQLLHDIEEQEKRAKEGESSADQEKRAKETGESDTDTTAKGKAVEENPLANEVD